VQEATRASGCGERRSKSDPEALDRPARTMEHARADDLELSLKILGDSSLLFKHPTQLARHREGPSFSILRRPGIKSDFARAEIDLSPLER
jgi:hypothetical protein